LTADAESGRETSPCAHVLPLFVASPLCQPLPAVPVDSIPVQNRWPSQKPDGKKVAGLFRATLVSRRSIELPDKPAYSAAQRAVPGACLKVRPEPRRRGSGPPRCRGRKLRQLGQIALPPDFSKFRAGSGCDGARAGQLRELLQRLSGPPRTQFCPPPRSPSKLPLPSTTSQSPLCFWLDPVVVKVIVKEPLDGRPGCRPAAPRSRTCS
jgi:hypothetical protein